MTTVGPLSNRGATKVLQTKIHNLSVERSVELTEVQSEWFEFGYAEVRLRGRVVEAGLHKKSKQRAKGADYESQGQVPSKARHVAPGWRMHEQTRPERPKYRVLRAFSAGPYSVSFTRGDVPRFARHLPLAFIFRAVGALFHFLCKAIAIHSNSEGVLPHILGSPVFAPEEHYVYSHGQHPIRRSVKIGRASCRERV